MWLNSFIINVGFNSNKAKLNLIGCDDLNKIKSTGQRQRYRSDLNLTGCDDLNKIEY